MQSLVILFIINIQKTHQTHTIKSLVRQHHAAVKTFIKPPLKAAVINYVELMENVKVEFT